MVMNLDHKAVDNNEKRVMEKGKTEEVANKGKKVTDDEKKIDNEDKMVADKENRNKMANK